MVGEFAGLEIGRGGEGRRIRVGCLSVGTMGVGRLGETRKNDMRSNCRTSIFGSMSDIDLMATCDLCRTRASFQTSSVRFVSLLKVL